MSQYEIQRLKAHWLPNAKQSKGTWRGGKGKKTFSPTAITLAYLIADGLNNKGEPFAYSQKTLAAQCGAAKSAVTSGLKQLEEQGVYSRSRDRADKATDYDLLIQCPPECPKKANHYNPVEFARLPQNQATPLPNVQESLLPNIQASGSPKNRQLITTNKQTNKERDNSSPCHSCRGLVETIASVDRVIHEQTCPELERLKRGKPWEITRSSNLNAWEEMTSAQQQRATWQSLAEGDKRRAHAEAQANEEARQTEERFEKALLRQCSELGERVETLLPGQRAWLRAKYVPGSEIAVNALTRALKYSREGRDLMPGGAWERGAWYGETDLQPRRSEGYALAALSPLATH